MEGVTIPVESLATLEPGKLYLLQLRSPVPSSTFERIQGYLNDINKRTGIRFVILDSMFELFKQDIVVETFDPDELANAYAYLQ